MKVCYENRMFIVSWFHYHPDNPSLIDLKGTTECIIKENGAVIKGPRSGIGVNPGKTLFTDYATCSNKETNYNKETGRKVSLARAIKGFPKHIRTVFWKAYFERKGK